MTLDGDLVVDHLLGDPATDRVGARFAIDSEARNRLIVAHLDRLEAGQHGRGEATVFIPIDGSARAIGRVMPLRIPQAELAIMLHGGPLADTDLTYGELGAHVLRHEISVEGPVRENYLTGFLDTEDPEQWETEIGWPIFRSDP